MSATTKHGVNKNSWGPFARMLKESKLPWLHYFLNLGAGLLSTTIMVKMPQVAGQIMSGEIYNAELIWTYVWVTVAMSVLSLATAAYSGWIDAATTRNLQRTVAHKLIHLPLKDYQKMTPSSLITRVTADTSWVSHAVSYFFSLIQYMYTLVLTMLTIWGMSHDIASWLLIMIPWSVFVCVVTGRAVRDAHEGRQNIYAQLANYVADRLYNIRLIKTYGAESIENKAGGKAISDVRKADQRIAGVEMICQPLTYSLEAVCQAVILILGGILVAKEKLTMDSMVAIVMYMQMLPIYALQPIMFWQNLKQAQGMSQKVGEVMAMPAETMQRKKSFALADADLRLAGVNFGYGDKKTLQDVSLTLPKGKITAIVGSSGAGKTTILSLLERFYAPSGGALYFGDTPAEDIHLNEWRGAFGYIPQNPTLLSGSIRENICFGVDREVSDEELNAAAKAANAYDFIMALPQGFDTAVGELGGKLSGGERQRIAIARTMLKNPDYLLLDEATSSLDAQNEAAVQTALRRMMQGRTAIVVTHNMKTVQNADHIVVMEHGAVTGSGTHDALYGTNALYTRFCDLQSAGEKVMA